MTAQQAVEKAPLSDLEDQWGNGLFPGSRWISIIYPGI